jgi:hypothetical protein
MSMEEAGKIRALIEAERWIRSTYDADHEHLLLKAQESGDPELSEKVAAYDASVEWVARGYVDPRVSFEAGAAWHRTRHDPLCACGETTPGPCIRRYPEGHNAVKCSAAPMTCMVCGSDSGCAETHIPKFKRLP